MKITAIRNSLFLLGGILALAGCSTNFQDYTPERIPQNPSGIYTFSFSTDLPSNNRVEGSERAKIVINGETYDMERSSKDDLTFTFDYKMPPGVTEARYYYIVSWDYSSADGIETATRYSTVEDGKVYQARLINRYPIQLVNDRGPAGSSIPIVGNGFSSQDVVLVGDTEALTTVHSSNSLEFIVPPLAAGRTWPVTVRTGSGDLSVGNFRIDEAAFSVQPQELFLSSGDMDFLIIETENAAPLGGLYVDARTDIPDSLIIPEIIIPEGDRSVNVNVTAGEPGSGVLVLSVPGYAPVEIPVTVD
ncbi:MAG: IPT/TIG domain-containing protein [Oceanipulchritudo sp.]